MNNLTDMLKLPTPRLLAYFKKHYRDRRGYIENHRGHEGYVTAEYYEAFMTEFNIIQTELNGREHVEKGAIFNASHKHSS